MGAQPVQLVLIQVEGPQVHEAGEGSLLDETDAVVPKVNQVEAGEVPEVGADELLDEVPSQEELSAIERPRNELGHVAETVLFAVEGLAQVGDVQIAGATDGADDRYGRPCLVARHGGVLVGHQAASGGRRSVGGSRPFSWLRLLLPFFTLR